MPAGSELASLVQLGDDITSFKFYTVSSIALLVYDYFLTIDDEIRYAWKMEGTPILVLFIVARYLPIPYLVWEAVATWSLSYTPEMCKKTAFLKVMYFTFITAFAHVFLAQRTYAITLKNKWITGILYAVATAEFGSGVYIFIHGALKPFQAPIPTIPLELYHVCLGQNGRAWVIIHISIAFGFDVVALVLVVVQAQLHKLKHGRAKGPNILGTICRDTEIYFAVVASSHLLTLIMFSVARPTLWFIGLVGYAVFIPIMTTRMIISLKKAITSREPHMTLEASSEFLTHPQDSLPPPPAIGMPLSVLRRGRR